MKTHESSKKMADEKKPCDINTLENKVFNHIIETMMEISEVNYFNVEIFDGLTNKNTPDPNIMETENSNESYKCGKCEYIYGYIIIYSNDYKQDLLSCDIYFIFSVTFQILVYAETILNLTLLQQSLFLIS